MAIETELATARMLMGELASGSMSMRLSGRDVTQREIVILKREIAFLEKVVARGPERPNP
jgi:hypothetical protein